MGVSSTTAVPDPTSNAYTVVSNSTCPGSAQRTFNGLMTPFPAGTGWQINNGVAFTTDTLVSIADDGATGYLVIARK
jgi:hypothetical protein